MARSVSAAALCRTPIERRQHGYDFPIRHGRFYAGTGPERFVFLNQFPLALPMSILTLVVLWIFFVAGADAGTVVLGSMSTGGLQEPKRWIKLSQGLAMAAISGILLVAGGLGALQSASVLFGVPFAFIMVAMCVAFYMHLRSEARSTRQDREDAPLVPRAGSTPSAGEAPPVTGQAFMAEEPAPGYNSQKGIEKPGREGR